MAAGKGSRLSSGIRSTACKALVKLGGAPLITYSLENLNSLGIKEAVIVIGRKHGEIPATLGSKYKGVSLAYVIQEKPVGLVNAMLSAKHLIRDGFVLQLSDEVFFGSQVEDALLPGNGAFDFSVGFTTDSAEKIRRNFSIETDEKMGILHCTEKPEQVFDDRKGTGFCAFSQECLDLLDEAYDARQNEPKDLCDFINLLISLGKKGRAVHIAEEEINVNTPEELQYAQKRFHEVLSAEAE